MFTVFAPGNIVKLLHLSSGITTLDALLKKLEKYFAFDSLNIVDRDHYHNSPGAEFAIFSPKRFITVFQSNKR